jgi:hypothetical protein
MLAKLESENLSADLGIDERRIQIWFSKQGMRVRIGLN